MYSELHLQHSCDAVQACSQDFLKGGYVNV